MTHFTQVKIEAKVRCPECKGLGEIDSKDYVGECPNCEGKQWLDGQWDLLDLLEFEGIDIAKLLTKGID